MDLDDELGDGEISTPKVKEIWVMEKQNLNQNIIITQSGLNLVKSILKHVELCNILNIYAFEITLGMIKFLDFYLFTVFYMFGSVDL